LHYKDKQVNWYFPEENNPIGVGEALVPRSSHFISKIGLERNIGISNRDIIKHCNGTLKLGIMFDGFNNPGEKFTFPFGLGEAPPYNAAATNRMMETERLSSDIDLYPDVSTHFRSTELLEYLNTQASKIPNLTINRSSVTLEQLKGTYDLLIDCTGLKSELSYIPDNYQDISHIIPNNCALVYRHAYTDASQLKPYSIFKAMNYGWVWNIPLGDQLAMGYVHSDKFDVMEEFIQAIKEKTGLDVTPKEIRKVKFITGRCKKHLTGNVVRVGLASGFIEPIESTGIYLITTALEKLTQYIDGELTEDEYNDLTNKNFDSIINFVVAHYKFSKRSNEYWDHYKNLDVEKYKETDLFPVSAWDYILSGFGEAERPKDDLDPKELIKIHRGTAYNEWLNNAKISS